MNIRPVKSVKIVKDVTVFTIKKTSNQRLQSSVRNIYKIYNTAHASLCRWCRSGRRWFHHSCHLRARAQITGVDV